MVLRPESAPIAFATCEAQPDFTPDDLLAVRELERLGFGVVPAVWDENRDWTAYRAVVVRSTWTYWLKLESFRTWLGGLYEARVPVFNSVPIVLGNLDKRYLGQLERAGHPVVPTRFVAKDDFRALASAREWAEGADDFILKPVVSGASYRTYRLSGALLAQARAEAESIWESGPAMLQPCLPAIFSEGEFSYVFFDGEFSHALKKRSATGDYRIQWQFGGENTRVTPTAEEIAHARRYFANLDETPLYARVDLIRHEGRLVLMELELTEPCLFFAEAPGSAERFARALARRLENA